MTLSANPALQNNLTYTFLAEGVTLGAARPRPARTSACTWSRSRDVEALIDGGGFVQALHTAPLLKFLLQRRRAGRE